MRRLSTRMIGFIMASAIFGGGPAYADNYYISSYSTSYNLPSDWPKNVDAWGSIDDFGPYTGTIDDHAGTPVWICTSGIHFNWDSPPCGSNNVASQPYGIGDSAPAIGIGVAYGACTYDPITHSCDQGPLGVNLKPGDSTCEAYSNHGSDVTNWWEYTIDNPQAGLYTFSAAVNFESGNSGYYAELTNCQLTHTPPSSSASP